MQLEILMLTESLTQMLIGPRFQKLSFRIWAWNKVHIPHKLNLMTGSQNCCIVSLESIIFCWILAVIFGSTFHLVISNKCSTKMRLAPLQCHIKSIPSILKMPKAILDWRMPYLLIYRQNYPFPDCNVI